MSATRYLELPSPYVLRRGGELTGARLAYETWGTLAPDAGNAVLILTGLALARWLKPHRVRMPT